MTHAPYLPYPPGRIKVDNFVPPPHKIKGELIVIPQPFLYAPGIEDPMADKEATARIKINKLLEAAGWRFFPKETAPANIT
jgi:hypothetical protein